MTARELDDAMTRLLATCRCEACERYRKSFALRAGYYAARIEERMKGDAGR